MSHFTKTALPVSSGLLAASILLGGVPSDEALAQGHRDRVGSTQRKAESWRVCGGDAGTGGNDGNDGEPPALPVACQGTAPASAMISDFSDATAGDPITFGAAPHLSGGTFSYAAPGLNPPALALTSGANGTAALHVTVNPMVPPDMVTNYFGFGLYFDSCVDASAYDSIEFTLSGDLGDCGLRFAPSSSENASPNDDPRGSCTLASCYPPSFPVTTSGTVSVRFAELFGGSPGVISATSLIGVQWQMDAPFGSTCTGDFSIDDVAFIDRAVPITPDASGRVEASTNPLGVEGQWHVYADSYAADGTPPGVCQAAGHTEDECSQASLPDSTVSGFPNLGGRMCTTGSTAQVLTVNGELDYLHMWGIGIALSLADAGGGLPAGTFDADAHGVVGVSFDIDDVPPGLRVEFPTPVDSLSFGASYWGADEFYPSSPVRAGNNVVLFRDVRSPDITAPPFDTTQIQRVGFLATSNPVIRIDFSYCVSNLKLLVE